MKISSHQILLSSAEVLLFQLGVLRVQAAGEQDPVVRTTLELMVTEIVGELGRRNEAVIAARQAQVAAILSPVTAIFSRPVRS